MFDDFINLIRVEKFSLIWWEKKAYFCYFEENKFKTLVNNDENKMEWNEIINEYELQ